MDTYKLEGSIVIKPIWWEDLPKILVKLDSKELYNGIIEKTKIIKLDGELNEGLHSLSVEFLNKKDSDTNLKENKDKVVIIESVEFFGINNLQFIWNQSYYEPIYPDHFDNKIKRLNGHNYLSWNGKWTLEFDLPIFTWIHRVTDLGWIYP